MASPSGTGATILCPKCGGQGHVCKPPYVAGDQHSWVANNASGYTCPVCHGAGVIRLLAEVGAALVTGGERDRRQIARLTEALREARPYVLWMASDAEIGDRTTAETVLAQVDAVLAGEEDARP